MHPVSSIYSLTLLACCLSFSLTSSSQTFVEGYLVTTKGDTITGFISQQSHLRKEIRFKKNAGEKDFQKFMPGDLSASYLKPVNENYISRILDIDMKSIDIRSLEEDDPNPRLVRDTLMLRILFTGKASLYTYQDNIKQHFFFEIEGDGIRELRNIKYYDRKTGSQVTLEDYKVQLKSEMPGCGINFDNVYYSEGPLANAFQKYNKCQGAVGKINTAAKTRTSKMFYVLAGASYNHGSYSEILTDYPASVNPVLGAGVEIKPVKEINHFSLTGELFWRTYATSMVVLTTPTAFKFDYFQFAVAGTYSFNSKFRPYGKAGASINYLTRKIGEFTYTDGQLFPVTDFASLSYGFLAAAGMNFDRIMIEARYESTIMYGFNAQFHIQSGVLMAGYRLKK